jgi:hypothetical protein
MPRGFLQGMVQQQALAAVPRQLRILAIAFC